MLTQEELVTDDLGNPPHIHIVKDEQVCLGQKFAPGWTISRFSPIPDLDDSEDETGDFLSWSHLIDEILDIELME